MLIPPGWERHVDDERSPYFYKASTDDTTWLLYWQLADAAGDAYFVNVETQASQWERPTDGVIVLASD
jgi:hypothetical protein